MRDPLLVKIQTTRRRRRPTFMRFVFLLAVCGGVGWLWFTVFSPLFTDPDDWVSKNKRYRRLMLEVISGRSANSPAMPDLPAWPPTLTSAQVQMLACAEKQVVRGVRIKKSYQKIDYPWGDVPEYLGMSPDLIIRCVRAAGLDLQQLVHIDRVRHPTRYPLHIWKHRRPDTSIDHRRLPILYSFIKHYLKPLPILSDSVKKRARFEPGDFVFWVAPGGGDYPGFGGIVLDRRDERGIPYVVTLASDDLRITDRHQLTDWKVMGHFRLNPDDFLDKYLTENPGARLQAR